MKRIVLYINIGLLLALCSWNTAAQGNCTAEYNCATCNSGGFTLRCTCNGTTASPCAGCEPGGCTGNCNKCCRWVPDSNGNQVKQCTGPRARGPVLPPNLAF